MGLNKSKGNMYSWITDTWNTVKGECPHGCTYCYMKRWGKQKPIHLDKGEFKTDMGSGNTIFIGSSCDLFAKQIPDGWIFDTLDYAASFENNYLLQSKNPARMLRYLGLVPNTVVCTTIESDSFYPDIMKDSPEPMDRSLAMQEISKSHRTYVTIEPVMKFNLEHMVRMIRRCNPTQVNIGADSGNNNLPEPTKQELLMLIDELKKFTVIDQKRNLDRISR